MSRKRLSAPALFRAAGPLAPLQGCASWAVGLSGWRRYLYAVLMGALAAAALPPVDLTPLLLVSFTSLIWLSDAGTRRGDAFFLGWCFGFGFFVAGLYWIGAALFVDIAAFWWLLPFAVLGFPPDLPYSPGRRCWRRTRRAAPSICAAQLAFSPSLSPGASWNGCAATSSPGSRGT